MLLLCSGPASLQDTPERGPLPGIFGSRADARVVICFCFIHFFIHSIVSLCCLQAGSLQRKHGHSQSGPGFRWVSAENRLVFLEDEEKEVSKSIKEAKCSVSCDRVRWITHCQSRLLLRACANPAHSNMEGGAICSPAPDPHLTSHPAFVTGNLLTGVFMSNFKP